MKFLLLALLFGFAAASFIDERSVALDAVQRHFDDSMVFHAETKKMKTKFGDFLEDALNNIVKDIKDNVERVKDVSKKVADKVTELRQKLRKLGEDAQTKSEEAVERVKNTVIDIVKAIETGVRNQTVNLDKQLDNASKLKFKDLIEKIKADISNKVRDVREYIKKTAQDNEVSKSVKELLDKLNDSELADLMRNFVDLSGHEFRHLQDLYVKLTALSSRTGGAVLVKLDDLVAYFRNMLKTTSDNIKENISNIREYIKKTAQENDINKSVKELLDKLNDSELADLMRNFVDVSRNEFQHLQDLYIKLTALSSRTGGALLVKLDDLVGYFRNMLKTTSDTIKEDITKVRARLLDLIGNTKDLTVEAAKDALNHLKAYKEELGDLYGKLVEALKKAVGNF